MNESNSPQGGDAPVSDARARALMLALGELSEAEREEALREARDNPKFAEEMRQFADHVALHRALPPQTPARGGFTRLAERMGQEGHMGRAVPGTHAMWRRSFAVAAVVLLAAGFMLFVAARRDTDEGGGQTLGTLHIAGTRGTPVSRTLLPGKEETLGDDDGDVWLATDRQGVSTKLRLAGRSRFVMTSATEFRLLDGEVLRAEVDPRAPYADGFLLETPQAALRTKGAVFSVKIDGGRSVLCVADGMVQARGRKSDEMRVVTDGMCTDVTETAPPKAPWKMLELSVEAHGDMQVLVTVTNRTARQLRVRKAGGGHTLGYILHILPDATPQDPHPPAKQVELLPDPGALGGVYDDHLGDAVLEPDGSLGNSRYRFVADLRESMVGMPRVDYTLSVQYTGPVVSDAFGERRLNSAYSPYTRVNLKLPKPPKRGE